MFFSKEYVALTCITAFVCTTAYATPNNIGLHTIIAPQCLIKQIESPYQTIDNLNNFYLISMNDNSLEQLVNTKHKDTNRCGGFIDVSNEWGSSLDAKKLLIKYTSANHAFTQINYQIHYENEVNQLIKQINPNSMWTRLQTLTQYPDRYANSDNGVQVANEIKAEIETLAKTYHRNDVTTYLVATGNQYKQPSVVVKIGQSNEPAVIIGGHMDTLLSRFEKKPGADDDGTGTVSVLQVANVLLSSDMRFKKPIYLIWYAAEEMGLVGSTHVVNDFKQKNIPVAAVMQLDMTGYAYHNDRTIWLVDDYVNADLSTYLQTLVNTYVKQPVKHTLCGYACSDHATWTQNGYTAAIPFESAYETYDPYIHSANDTMEKLSLDHMTDFVKLGVAFAVELAEPVGKQLLP